MEPFIRSDQYNFIKAQTKILINGHSTVNDQDVLKALKSLAIEKVSDFFTNLSDKQMQLLNPILKVEDKEDAQEFLSTLKPYVIPFKDLSEKTIKKLFPKAKKLKLPSLEDIDLKEVSYLGWTDKGSNKKYIVADIDNKLIGLQGSIKSTSQTGICAICNAHEETAMFISQTKGSGKDTFTKRGNYICQDSQKCNQNIMALDKLNDFILRLNG
ncbi:hypothetical protein JOC86_004705 [Bacillus pakistanensis]|uniref:Elongation factor G-binding protein n=1 Tax=Rossellomorea pakistanensis TaxID=992288 RepID=A0ABS2NJY7_9BACI|nr:FusB/FusC family EF-G-binding protein [Bacillus pakistanensis]MBM7588130.1 hypothetical protein [Bacillus pakistanensis]